METKTFQDRDLRASVEVDKDQCWVTVQELKTGHAWPRVPVMALEIYDRAQLRVDRLLRYDVDQIEPVDGGIHLTVRDRLRGIEVGMWLRIVDGQLSVMLPPAEVYEF